MKLSQKQSDKIIEIIMIFIVNFIVFLLIMIFGDIDFLLVVLFSLFNSAWIPFTILPLFDKLNNTKKPTSLYEKLMENPIMKEQKSIYDMQCKMIEGMKSTDKDEIPWGHGEFGYDATNPIPTKTSFGNTSYLARLQTLKGEKVVYNRIGSTIVPNIENPVDIYEISDSNGFICKLYLSMYHRRNSEMAPRNFKKHSI